MTTRTRFYIAIAATVVAAIVFWATFANVFPIGKKTDFLQGFSGGIAFGAFLGVLTYGTKLRQERQATMSR